MIRNKEAKQYAKALFSIAKNTNKINQVLNNLKLLNQFYTISLDYRSFLISRRIDLGKKKQIINDIFIKIFSPLERDLIIELIDNNCMDLLSYILKEYVLLCNKGKETVDVVLSTVEELTSNEIVDFSNNIEKQLDKKINLKSIIDPNLLGGAKLRINNLIIDGSIYSRLRKLKETLY